MEDVQAEVFILCRGFLCWSVHIMQGVQAEVFILCRGFLCWSVHIMQGVSVLKCSYYAGGSCAEVFILCRGFLCWSVHIMQGVSVLKCSYYAGGSSWSVHIMQGVPVLKWQEWGFISSMTLTAETWSMHLRVMQIIPAWRVEIQSCLQIIPAYVLSRPADFNEDISIETWYLYLHIRCKALQMKSHEAWTFMPWETFDLSRETRISCKVFRLKRSTCSFVQRKAYPATKTL